jgi:hypothetical protein
MPVPHREKIFTIGGEPFVAGTIVVRNSIRARKQHRRQLRWNALASRFRIFRRLNKPGKAVPLSL